MFKTILFFLSELDNNSLFSLAAQIVNITGYHTGMRYPDSSGTSIPADRFSRDQARRTVQLALELLQTVQDDYID